MQQFKLEFIGYPETFPDATGPHFNNLESARAQAISIGQHLALDGHAHRGCAVRIINALGDEVSRVIVV